MKIDFTGKLSVSIEVSTDEFITPHQIFDAAGVEHKRVRRCDTVTGEIEKEALGPLGGEGKVFRGDVKVERVLAPAPLEVFMDGRCMLLRTYKESEGSSGCSGDGV